MGRVFGQDLTNQSRQGGSANQQRGKPALKKQKTLDDLVQKRTRTHKVVTEAEEEVKSEPLSLLRAWDVEDAEDDLCVTDYITDIMAALKSQEMEEDLYLDGNDFMKA